MKPKYLCLLGLFFFLASYILFSKILPHFESKIDFAHWFNLIGACLLLSFNDVFPKNKLNSAASFVTFLGMVAHIGLCTIDMINSSYGNDDAAQVGLSLHIVDSPFILYPFVIVGPSLLFIGLAMHAFNFIKTNTISTLMVIIAAPAIGISFFMLKNGVLMLLSCTIFVLGLGLLLFEQEKQSVKVKD